MQQQGYKDDMEEDKTHQRNESIYSMDSFVADFVSQDEEKSDPPSPEKVRPHTYISPSSSAATTPQAIHNRNAMFQDTIDSMSGFGNETPVPRQAPNPFFSPSYYNEDASEVSDGSFIIHETPVTPDVMKHQQGQPPTAQSSQSHQFLPRQAQSMSKRVIASTGEERDRFPSFDDSVGSSSSIQYIQNPKPPSKPAPSPPPANVPLTAEQIQRLPYHERRKLLAQRRQQQQQQQSMAQLPAGSRPGIPQQPPPAQQQQSHRIMTQQPQQMYPQYIMPPADVYAYPNGPVMMQQQHPLLPGQSPYGRPSYQGVPPPPPPVGPPPAYGNYTVPPQGMGYYPMAPPGYPVPPPPMPQQPPFRGSSPVQQQRGKEHLQTAGLPRGYVGVPRDYQQQQQQQQQQKVNTSSQSIIGRTRSSSFDSSDENKQGRRSSAPPPPPPLPSAHTRVDSSGSVSSFESLDRSNSKDDDSGNRRQENDKGFLARLNPWGPKVPNVDDYHRKNQAFLKKANKERQRTPSPSPKQEIRRVHLGSMDRPPPSRGTHKRLPSIDNDNWEEDTDGKKTTVLKSDTGSAQRSFPRTYSSGEDSGYGEDRPPSRVPPRFKNKSDIETDERLRLLPPPGISSNEQSDKVYMGENSSTRLRPDDNPEIYGSMTATTRTENRSGSNRLPYDYEQNRKNRKKKKKSKSRSRRSRHEQPEESSDASYSSSSASSQDYHRWMKKRSRLLEKERTKLMKKWREEAKAEEETIRLEREKKLWYNRLGRYLHSEFGHLFEAAYKFLTWGEAFIANIPLTINAIALAMANLGVVWFKFAEENMESCEPVHYHSSQCTFPEFPGCFYCDTHARMYKIAVNFHWGCSTIAGILAFLFICKLIIAPRVVFDELGSPTTAAPAGLFCMTLDIVFAGRGVVGQAFVTTASCIHLCLAVWFIYMALAYHIMPEPSWFPNTTSIGISAIKSWLYYPMAGHFLMAISLSLNFFFFPISLIRVAVNRKISATVGWMQMSAPNVSLYALTLMAQPSFEEEHPDITKFQVVHRLVYLPCMHILFGLCILGMCASLHSLAVRWKDFRKLPFSPAHAAFCVPTLSHANAVQAYRAAVNSFSDIPVGSPFKVFLYIYWVTVLAGGTVVTLWIGSKFLSRLPEWTHIDTEGEIEPPAPYETAMTSSNLITTGETLVQPFVSPAILQANETGTLVLSRNSQGDQVYRRTRKVTAFGFEPIMSELQMDIERDLLLDWVARNPPRRRHRTLSVPGIDFSYGEDIGTGSGVYGADSSAPWGRHQRATTSSPYTLLGRKSTTNYR